MQPPTPPTPLTPSEPPEGGRPLRIGPYDVVGLLGRGGMGHVYRAVHRATGAEHALKVLPVDRITPRALERFRREAEALARVDGLGGVVRVHGFGEDGGRPWCAMERVAGRPLSEVLAGGPLPPEEAARLVARIARTLDGVHGAGIVHRDLKPENVVLDPEGQPRVIDFGLAFDDLAESLTGSGAIVGSLLYMAPEQLRPVSGAAGAARASPATDVYGLGGVLFATLTGRAPFEEKASPAGVMHAIMLEEPPWPDAIVPGVSRELGVICRCALRKEPTDRYRSAGALADDLERFLAGEPIAASTSPGLLRRLRPRRATPIVLTAVFASVALLAVVASPAWLGPRTAGSGVLDDAEARLATGRELPPSLLATLEQIAESAPAEPARRAAALACLSGLLARAEPDDARFERARRLAILIRPQASVDRALQATAESALLRSGRLDALAVVLFGRDPPAVPSARAASQLAPALAGDLSADADIPALAASATAFAALHGAAGLRSDEQGRLLVVRGRAALARVPPDVDVAFAAFGEAFARHGTLPPVAGWPDALHVQARGVLLEERGGELRRLRPAATLIVRAEDGPALPPRTVAVLQDALMAASHGLDARHARDAQDVERTFVLAAVLDRLGASPVSASFIRGRVASIVEMNTLEALLEAELERPSELRNPAFTLVLARVLAESEDDEARSAAVEAARRVGVDPSGRRAWARFIVAEVLAGAGLRGEAHGHARLALELDRRRPQAQRWARLAELASRLALDPGRADLVDERFGIDAAWDAAELVEAAAPRVREIEAAGGIRPWVLAPTRGVSGLLRRVARLLIARGAPACCAEGRTVPELLDRSAELDPTKADEIAKLRDEHGALGH